MKLLVNQKLATRISIITTAITLAGMLLLWVSYPVMLLPLSKTILPTR